MKFLALDTTWGEQIFINPLLIEAVMPYQWKKGRMFHKKEVADGSVVRISWTSFTVMQTPEQIMGMLL